MSKFSSGSNTGGFSMPNSYHQTVQIFVYQNVCFTDYKIICLSETWLNDLCCVHKFVPDSYTAYCSDRVCGNKMRGGVVLIAIWHGVRTFKHRRDLEFLRNVYG
jgi:hypothetical protein